MNEKEQARAPHAWAVCAYGDSPYLETCLKSIRAQKTGSPAVICTSTPSPFLRAMAEKYDMPLRIRKTGTGEDASVPGTGNSGIAADWNFAYRQAAELGETVTLAHQDDCYGRDYVPTLLAARRRWPDMSLFTCASVTAKDRTLHRAGLNEIVKMLLRLPLRFPQLCSRSGWKRAAVSLGNPVICPACSYVTDLCPEVPFSGNYRFVLDWDLLVRLAEMPGRWICTERPLIVYRVHGDAATAESIRDHSREQEEAEMFRRLLPGPAARIVGRLYRKAYDAYQ